MAVREGHDHEIDRATSRGVASGRSAIGTGLDPARTWPRSSGAGSARRRPSLQARRRLAARPPQHRRPSPVVLAFHRGHDARRWRPTPADRRGTGRVRARWLDTTEADASGRATALPRSSGVWMFTGCHDARQRERFWHSARGGSYRWPRTTASSICRECVVRAVRSLVPAVLTRAVTIGAARPETTVCFCFKATCRRRTGSALEFR